MAEPIMVAKGLNGWVELYENKVKIRRVDFKGNRTKINDKGDKDILLTSLTAIQFRRRSIIVPGYIQFVYMGSSEANTTIMNDMLDENTVTFQKKGQPYFEKIKEAIEEAMERIQTSAPPTVAALSNADELEKFAALKEKGIISEEEFQQKKKQILGL